MESEEFYGQPENVVVMFGAMFNLKNTVPTETIHLDYYTVFSPPQQQQRQEENRDKILLKK